MITTGVQTRKKDKDGELKVFDITELPEEYLRTEYREDWEYLEKVRESLRNRFIF
jgi:hypothetical protein